MFKKFSIVLTAMFCLAKAGIAQEMKPCMTDEMYWETVKKYPQILEYEKQFEEQMTAVYANGLPGVGAKTTLSPFDTTMFDVPLVVHIVHDYGAEYLPDNDVYEAVKYWAVVFLAQNADTANVIDPFKKYVGNPRIRLHLATIDPNGNPTKGVVHEHSYLTGNANDQAKYNPWPNNKYINLWFINTFGAASTGAAAYAYYPASAAGMPYYDGVIGLYTYINYAKAIPHELGHVLNLQHVWGNTNAPDVACGDDQVWDTPPTKGHNPVGCTAAALYDVTCATGYTHAYTSISGLPDSVVNFPDTTNAQNIMDYTYCQDMFTKGQCDRMRNALTSGTAGRNNLITAANLAATGALAPMPDLPPVADFSVERATGSGIITDARTVFLTPASGANFNFKNRSWNDTISAVNWTFSNGATTPTSTSTTSVLNRFTTTGWVTVTLAATSNAGTTTLVNDHAVYVADTTPVGGFGYNQSFSNSADVANWPAFNYFENQYKWGQFTGASNDGDNGCMRFRSYDTTQKRSATPLGDHDDLCTPAFNLAGMTGPVYLNFNSAAAAANSGSISGPVGDSLEIHVTINGGQRWNKIIGYKRGTLVNNGTKSSEFVPGGTATWTARGVAIPAAYLNANTYFRFRYWPGNVGNNFYMDGFKISGFPADVAEIANSGMPLTIFPNPTNNGCNLVFKTGNENAVHISIKDITGRVVYQSTELYAPNSAVQQPIGRDLTPTAGIYFVSVVIDGNVTTQKLVVY
ncbi:hypothetical protein CJD36_021665 [Flavipsychrobacter stenotrophus]|uniref:PKD domain-containing protein n=1 Tax=Flavipsychrobacter stenotrophus TaxID=2077091 RepID=A0A2S7SQH9_9BACT|nr:zinc-dependent metalloprotease [Flavipsychrobacter stenotrophus]PQJ08881.1 hypothetical protein CJD36_021665 [Flavipsychrobacter stenotrophus]